MTSLTGASGEDFASILRSLGYRMERRPKPAEAPPAAAQPACPTHRRRREQCRAAGPNRSCPAADGLPQSLARSRPRSIGGSRRARPLDSRDALPTVERPERRPVRGARNSSKCGGLGRSDERRSQRGRHPRQRRVAEQQGPCRGGSAAGCNATRRRREAAPAASIEAAAAMIRAQRTRRRPRAADRSGRNDR